MHGSQTHWGYLLLFAFSFADCSTSVCSCGIHHICMCPAIPEKKDQYHWSPCPTGPLAVNRIVSESWGTQQGVHPCFCTDLLTIAIHLHHAVHHCLDCNTCVVSFRSKWHHKGVLFSYAGKYTAGLSSSFTDITGGSFKVLALQSTVSIKVYLPISVYVMDTQNLCIPPLSIKIFGLGQFLYAIGSL